MVDMLSDQNARSLLQWLCLIEDMQKSLEGNVYFKIRYLPTFSRKFKCINFKVEFDISTFILINWMIL
jgi:hypothetical protein